MRQETIVKTYLTFDELTKEQKTKVIDKNRDINIYHGWWEYIKDDFITILNSLGFNDIELFFSGFSSQGDGASFSGIFKLPENNNELIKRLDQVEDYAPNFFKDNSDIIELYKNLDFTDWVDDQDFISICLRGYYSHSNTMMCDHEKLQTFARYMADRYYKMLDSTYWYLIDDEAIEDTLTISEYEFDNDTLEIV